MDRSPLDLPPSHRLPVIDHIPAQVRSNDEDTDVLGEFVARGMRAWGGQPVAVPGAAAAVFWLALGAGAAVGIWLAAVRFAGAPCSGLPCHVATWAGMDLLLVLATVSVVMLAAVATMSRGMARMSPLLLAAALLGTGCGAVAVSGVVALILLLLVSMAVVVAVLFAVVDRL